MVRCVHGYRFKEKSVNQATQSLIRAVEFLAEQEGRPTEEVMTELMEQPATLFPKLFSAENMKQLMPEGVTKVLSGLNHWWSCHLPLVVLSRPADSRRHCIPPPIPIKTLVRVPVATLRASCTLQPTHAK